MGTHMRVLSERYPMNTNMTGFRWFSKSLRYFDVHKSIGRVKEKHISITSKHGNRIVSYQFKCIKVKSGIL